MCDRVNVVSERYVTIRKCELSDTYLLEFIFMMNRYRSLLGRFGSIRMLCYASLRV